MASYLKTGRRITAGGAPVNAAAPSPKKIEIKPINFEVIEVDIGGISPLVQNNGKPIADDDFNYFRILDHHDRDCIELDQLKRCLLNGATRGRPLQHAVIKTDVFLKSVEDDSFDLIPIVAVGDSPVVPHLVRKRIGHTSFSRNYPKYPLWGTTFRIEYRPERVSPDAVINHLHDVGFSCGIGELCPSKGGQFGRFSVIAVRSAR